MSFFFRILGVVAAFVLVALPLVEKSDRLTVLYAGLAMCGILFFGVYLFAWLAPKNLAYGEAGYRAESKFQFGTEKQEVGQRDLSTVTGMTNPNAKSISNGGVR